MKINDIVLEDGRIVPGVNTTDDVGPDEIKIQAKKMGFDVTKDGIPPLLYEHLEEEALERQDVGMGLQTFHNNDIAFMGGMRSGNSGPGETRLRYNIYDIASTIANHGEENVSEFIHDYEVGLLELFVQDGTGKIMGIVNIKITKPGNRKGGLGSAIVKSLLDSPYTNRPLRVHDIKKNAVPFWRKMGVQFTRSDFKSPIKTSSKTNRGIYGIIP